MKNSNYAAFAMLILMKKTILSGAAKCTEVSMAANYGGVAAKRIQKPKDVSIKSTSPLTVLSSQTSKLTILIIRNNLFATCVRKRDTGILTAKKTPTLERTLMLQKKVNDLKQMTIKINLRNHSI